MREEYLTIKIVDVSKDNSLYDLLDDFTDNLREQDWREAVLLYKAYSNYGVLGVEKLILESLVYSIEAYGVIIDGKLQALFGVSSEELAIYHPWFICTKEFERDHLRRFKVKRLMKEYAKGFLDTYPYLTNETLYSDKEERWLQWLGFSTDIKIENDLKILTFRSKGGRT